jgi:hypothetical protein
VSQSVAATHRAGLPIAYDAGKALSAAGSEWAAVSFFYAAYRAVRTSMNNDIRLNSDSGARAIDPRLSATTRHVDFHSGHPSRGPGLNDVVQLLYPEIGSKYVLLHIKSVEVRYLNGLVGLSLSGVQQLTDDVISHLERLKLL